MVTAKQQEFAITPKPAYQVIQLGLITECTFVITVSAISNRARSDSCITPGYLPQGGFKGIGFSVLQWIDFKGWILVAGFLRN
jgi:hypothetical protein